MMRPPLITSAVAAWLASTAGWRYVLPQTSVPMPTRGTAAASAATTDQHSSIGPSAASSFDMKWSAT